MRWWPLILALTVAFAAFSQKTAKVTATYIYRAGENVTLEEAKRIALDRAKIQAIADEFGSMVSQTNITSVDNRDGHSTVDFQSIGGSDVRGEWSETFGEPVYDITLDQRMLVVGVTVKGRIREIVRAKADLAVKILRNGTDNRFESSEFRNGDDLYLAFQSPVNGYLAVYLIDNHGDAYCLLPYRGQTDGIYHVEANRRYLFFSQKEAPMSERSIVDEYVMTAQSREHNQILLIFSPNPFTKAIDTQADTTLPRSTTRRDLSRWLASTRKRDTDIQSHQYNITIHP